MSGRRAITLVARREIRERLRGKLLLISTLVMVLLVAGSAALQGTLSKNPTYHVAVTAPYPPGLLTALERAAKPFDNAKVQLRTVPTPAAGRQALETKKVDALLLLPQNQLIFRSEVDVKAAAVADIAVRALRHHLPPAPELSTATLHNVDKPKTTDAETLVAYAGSILLLMSLAVYGQWVVSGVVEEKNSRVVEVILSTVRARDLLAGKVIGIGTGPDGSNARSTSGVGCHPCCHGPSPVHLGKQDAPSPGRLGGVGGMASRSRSLSLEPSPWDAVIRDYRCVAPYVAPSLRKRSSTRLRSACFGLVERCRGRDSNPHGPKATRF